MLGENYQDPNQKITYDINVRTDQVQQAMDDLDARARKMADSLSALSGGYLTNMAAAAQAGMQGPSAGSPLAGNMFTMGMIPQTAMAQQQAMAMGGAFSPGAIMARDAMGMQLAAMGPSTGAGPSLTTPWGDATVNYTRTQASPFQLNTAYMPFMGPTSAPGDPRRGMSMFSTAEGSASDVAGMFLGRMTGYGLANDNLEDRMMRNIERRMTNMGENISGAARWGAMDLGMGALGTLAGSAFGPVGGLVGGVAGSMAGGIMNQTFGRMAQPFVDMSKDFRQYTAPFIRGERIGGGMSERERAQMVGEFTKRTNADNWFTSKEYQDLIGIAGETGLFQFTGNKDQALKAVDKLGASVKALYSLGVKSREMLGEVDKMIGTFGLNPGKDPAQMANFYATMAVAAQSAGMSTAQMTQAAAPAAQLFANQGLGFATGARIGAMNLGAAGELFRGGRLGAFENTYYGGKEGFANALSQGQAASMRTPIGETYLMSLFGDNMKNLNTVLGGGTLSTNDIMRGAGRLASTNPGEFMGIRARMPWLMQNVPGEFLAMGDAQSSLAEFRQIYGKKGPVSSLEYLNYLIQGRGQDPTSANAQLDFIMGGGDTAQGIRRSARDQLSIQQAEGLRAQGLDRRMAKFYERNIAPIGVGVTNLFQQFGANVGQAATEALTGVHTYELGADGMRVFSPFDMETERNRALERVRNMGLSPIASLTERRPETTYQESMAEAAGRLMGGKNATAMAMFERSMATHGIGGDEATTFRRIVTEGKAELRVGGAERAALDAFALDVTGERSKAGAQAALLQDGDKRKDFLGRAAREGYSETFANAYLNDTSVVAARKDLPRGMADRLEGALAGASPRPTTAGLTDPAHQEIVNRLADHDTAGLARATNELKGLGYSQAEIDTFRQTTYEDKLKTNPFSLDAMGLSARGMDDARSVAIAEGSARTWRRRNLSPERFGQLLGVFDRETRQKMEDFRANNLDLVKGIQASQNQTDDVLGGMAGDVVGQLRARGDMGAVEGAITGDRQTTIESLSKLTFQRPYAELSNQQKYQFGGVLDVLRKERMDRGKRQMLDDLVEGTSKDAGDPRMMMGEKLNNEIRVTAHNLGPVGQRLMGDSVEASDALENGQIYLRKSVEDIIKRSSGYTDAAQKLKTLGVGEQQYAQYGIDVDAFKAQGSRYSLDYHQNVVNKALGEMATKDPERYKKFAGMDGDFETWFPHPEEGFKNTEKLVQLQQQKLDLAPKALSAADLDNLRLRFGSDRIGGISVLGKGIGGMTWESARDLMGKGTAADTRSVVEALSGDDKVKSVIGRDGMDRLIGASGKLSEGKDLSDKELLDLVKQVAPGKTDRDISLLREESHRAGKTDAQIGLDVLNRTLSSTLTGGMAPGSTVGDKMGTMLDPDVKKSMIQAFNQQMQLADQMQKLSEQIDPTKQNQLMEGINSLVKNMSGGGTPAEQFGKALDEYAKNGGGKAINVRIVDGASTPAPVRVVGDSTASQNQAAPAPAQFKNGGVPTKAPLGPQARPATATPNSVHPSRKPK